MTSAQADDVTMSVLASVPNSSRSVNSSWMGDGEWVIASHPYAEYPVLKSVCQNMYLVVGAVGVLANLVVIFTVLFTKRLKNNTYILILNACIADLYVLAFKTVPTFIEHKTETWPLGQVLCKLYGLSWTLSDCASVLCMLAISAERFIVITKPLHAPSILTMRNRVSTVVAIWTVAFACAVRELFHFEQQTIMGMTQCTKLHVESMRYFLLAEFFLFFVAPMATMIYLYGAVTRSLYQSIYIRRGMVANSTANSANENSETSRARLKIVVMMIVVAILFAVTSVAAKWSIIFCTQVLGVVPIMAVGHNLFGYLWIQNSIIIRSFDSVANPFIYFALSANLRESFMQIVRAITCKSESQSQLTSSRGITMKSTGLLSTNSEQANRKLSRSIAAADTTQPNGRINSTNILLAPKPTRSVTVDVNNCPENKDTSAV